MLKPGSRMVFFTDGITATNAGGAAYTDYTLHHTVTIIMANYPNLSARDMIKRIGTFGARACGRPGAASRPGFADIYLQGGSEERPVPDR